MAFGYLKDPLFILCFSAYWMNRYIESVDLSTGILRSYLNDLICLPFWIPIMLWAHRRLGLRRHDEAPHVHEIVIPLVLWSLIFEVILPTTRTWSGLAVADPVDVLCYAIGALVAALFWAWWYPDASIASNETVHH